jgi:hypothetical protein
LLNHLLFRLTETGQDPRADPYRDEREASARISVHAPFGWDFGRNGLLVENAREQKIIARIRRMDAEGMSFRGIAARVDEEGIRPERGKRLLHTTVKSILTRKAA